MRSTSAAVFRMMSRRLGRRDGKVHSFAISVRCRRRIVSGVTLLATDPADIEEALRISDATGSNAYDSNVLACAKAPGTWLLSLDAGMVEVATSMDLDIGKINS
jgi:hypothetical protein